MDRIRATGAELWTIANDDPDALRALRESEGLDFPILLDPDATVIREWGILNDRDDRGRLIPYPTLVIVDRDGSVRWVHSDLDYRQRPPADEVVARLRESLR